MSVVHIDLTVAENDYLTNGSIEISIRLVAFDTYCKEKAQVLVMERTGTLCKVS